MDLWKQGLAPFIVMSGSGTSNHQFSAWGDFEGKTEAEVFAAKAIELGVPKENILIEDKSQNTGQNYEFVQKLLETKGIGKSQLKTVICVQKPYMERRTFATGKIWWPDIEILVTSPPLSIEDMKHKDHCINELCGDLQRIKVYPEKGFQIHQDIPDQVWKCWEILTEKYGHTSHLLS